MTASPKNLLATLFQQGMSSGNDRLIPAFHILLWGIGRRELTLHTLLLTMVCKLQRGEFAAVVGAEDMEWPSTLCFSRRLDSLN